MKFRTNRSGFSLVELAIGLAVVTVLILAISMSSGIRDNARVQSAADSVQALRTAVETYISSGNVDYSKVSIQALIDGNLLPSGFVATASNAWGGDYSVGPNATPTRFDIALTGVAQTDATKLDAHFINISNGSSYDASSQTWTVTF